MKRKHKTKRTFTTFLNSKSKFFKSIFNTKQIYFPHFFFNKNPLNFLLIQTKNKQNSYLNLTNSKLRIRRIISLIWPIVLVAVQLDV